MSRSNADLLALKAELTNDPKTLGLDTNPAHDEANANKLNEVLEDLPVTRRSLTSAQLFNSIAPLEHQSLSDQQARYLDSVLSLGQIDPFLNTTITAALHEMFGEESDTRESLSVLFVQNGNRIDQMFQAGLLEQGGIVTPSDIAQARNAT